MNIETDEVSRWRAAYERLPEVERRAAEEAKSLRRDLSLARSQEASMSQALVAKTELLAQREAWIARLEARVKLLEQRHANRWQTKLYRAASEVPSKLAAKLGGSPQVVAPATPTVAAPTAANPDRQRVRDPNDLTWEQFNASVLARRSEFKGIFVQEVVIDWKVQLHQRPQQLAEAMGRAGYLVLYRTGNHGDDNVEGFRQVAPNVWLTNSPEVANIPDTVRSIYSTASGQTAQGLYRTVPSTLVYEYIDHIDPQISGAPELIRRLVALKDYAFSGSVDYVVASSKALYDEAVERLGAERTLLVPNGVDCRHWRREVTAELPPEYRAFRSKYARVVGYFGALAPWLWYELIHDVAHNQPDVGFVFIGPDYYGGVDRLPRLPNVLHIDAVDYKVLPAYAALFDVCFIPFALGDIARSTSPLKLFEYFAMEKPVVVTSDLIECTQYPEVFAGGTAAEVCAAMDRAFAVKDEPSFKRRLRDLADRNDWNARAAEFARAFSRPGGAQ